MLIAVFSFHLLSFIVYCKCIPRELSFPWSEFYLNGMILFISHYIAQHHIWDSFMCYFIHFQSSVVFQCMIIPQFIVCSLVDGLWDGFLFAVRNNVAVNILVCISAHMCRNLLNVGVELLGQRVCPLFTLADVTLFRKF